MTLYLSITADGLVSKWDSDQRRYDATGKTEAPVDLVLTDTQTAELLRAAESLRETVVLR